MLCWPGSAPKKKPQVLPQHMWSSWRESNKSAIRSGFRRADGRRRVHRHVYQPRFPRKEADALLTQLKPNHMPESVTKQIMEKERHTLSRPISPDALGALVTAVKVVATELIDNCFYSS